MARSPEPAAPGPPGAGEPDARARVLDALLSEEGRALAFLPRRAAVEASEAVGASSEDERVAL